MSNDKDNIRRWLTRAVNHSLTALTKGQKKEAEAIGEKMIQEGGLRGDISEALKRRFPESYIHYLFL